MLTGGLEGCQMGAERGHIGEELFGLGHVKDAAGLVLIGWSLSATFFQFDDGIFMPTFAMFHQNV